VTKKRGRQLGIHSLIPSSGRDFSLHHRIQQAARIAVTGYKLDNPWFDSQQEQENFLSTTASSKQPG
jgi:hypothetical protein